MGKMYDIMFSKIQNRIAVGLYSIHMLFNMLRYIIVPSFITVTVLENLQSLTN